MSEELKPVKEKQPRKDGLRVQGTYYDPDDDKCVVCAEPIGMDDYNEMFLIEPLNKRVWWLKVCMSCQDNGPFDRWIQGHIKEE